MIFLKKKNKNYYKKASYVQQKKKKFGQIVMTYQTTFYIYIEKSLIIGLINHMIENYIVG